MNKLILGFDAGNDKGKVAGICGVDAYKTNICEWFQRDEKEVFGDDDVEFEIGGRKGFAGTIAEYEDEFGSGNMYGDSKAHEDTLIRVLLGLSRYIEKYCPHINTVSLITGQPIKRCGEDEKVAIKKMLEGRHDFTVNGRKQTLYIERVGVVPEASGAFWAFPRNGTVRILDIGSGTVNASTMRDKRHVHNGSNTFNFGMGTVNNKDDLAGIARGIIRNTTVLKWQRDDFVYICGGIAEEISPFITEHYTNATVLYPQNNGIPLHPVFANAVGYYDIAQRAFR